MPRKFGIGPETAKNEPAAAAGALLIAVSATIALLAFVFNWSEDLRLLVDAAVLAWVAVLAAWVRGRVTPTAKLPPPSPPSD